MNHRLFSRLTPVLVTLAFLLAWVSTSAQNAALKISIPEQIGGDSAAKYRAKISF